MQSRPRIYVYCYATEHAGCLSAPVGSEQKGNLRVCAAAVCLSSNHSADIAAGLRSEQQIYQALRRSAVLSSAWQTRAANKVKVFLSCSHSHFFMRKSWASRLLRGGDGKKGQKYRTVYPVSFLFGPARPIKKGGWRK